MIRKKGDTSNCKNKFGLSILVSHLIDFIYTRKRRALEKGIVVAGTSNADIKWIIDLLISFREILWISSGQKFVAKWVLKLKRHQIQTWDMENVGSLLLSTVINKSCHHQLFDNGLEIWGFTWANLCTYNFGSSIDSPFKYCARLGMTLSVSFPTLQVSSFLSITLTECNR